MEPQPQPQMLSQNEWVAVTHAKAAVRQAFVNEVQRNLIRLHSKNIDTSDTQVRVVFGVPASACLALLYFSDLGSEMSFRDVFVFCG